MLTKLIRDYQLWKNHKKRVNSIVLRSNDEIVRFLDQSRSSHLEADRLERTNDSIRFKAMKETLEWLIDDTK